MSVLLETSLGDIVIDLYTTYAPASSALFLNICACKWYNDAMISRLEKEFIVEFHAHTDRKQNIEQNESQQALWKDIQLNYRKQTDTISKRLTHDKFGTVGLVGSASGLGFYITLGADLTYLDGREIIIGQVVEGLDVLHKLNNDPSILVDSKKHLPHNPIKIRHTIIVDHSQPDLYQSLVEQHGHVIRSPRPIMDPLDYEVFQAELAYEESTENSGENEEERQRKLALKEARSKAEVLEMIGDLPDADIAPPENILFVCKLNPITTEEDLELIFSRFGLITKCDIIKDWKTGNSLQFAFIEFEKKEACEQAYFKMNNALIDDRRIKVDFSQSVSKLYNQHLRHKQGKTRPGQQQLHYQDNTTSSSAVSSSSSSSSTPLSSTNISAAIQAAKAAALAAAAAKGSILPQTSQQSHAQSSQVQSQPVPVMTSANSTDAPRPRKSRWDKQ